MLRTAASLESQQGDQDGLHSRPQTVQTGQGWVATLTPSVSLTRQPNVCSLLGGGSRARDGGPHIAAESMEGDGVAVCSSQGWSLWGELAGSSPHGLPSAPSANALPAHG